MNAFVNMFHGNKVSKMRNKFEHLLTKIHTNVVYLYKESTYKKGKGSVYYGIEDSNGQPIRA